MMPKITGPVIRFFEQVGQVTKLILETLYYVICGEIDFKEVVKQMLALGVQSIPIVLTVSGFTGMVFSLQVSQEFERFGAASLIGQLLSLAVVRELGPVLTGVVVAGRAGSAIAAEIGTMKITEQVDALRALATSPTQYLVVPRFMACLIMLPVLTVFANLFGMIGGYLVAVYQIGVVPQVFFESSVNFIRLYDLFCSLIKAAVFGVIIVFASCVQGLNTEKGAQGVGDSAIASVVNGMIGVFIANYFLSLVLFKS